jgi:hypothetical protein
MKAQDLAAYFSKKIAKPIAYSYRSPTRHGRQTATTWSNRLE